MDHYFQQLLRDFAATGDPDVAMKIAHQALRRNDAPLPGYLAVGINYDQAYTFSRRVEDINNPQQVYDYLARENGVPFDEILILENGAPCPVVIHLWNHGRDFNDLMPTITIIEGPTQQSSTDWTVTFETQDLGRIHLTPWTWTEIDFDDGYAQAIVALPVSSSNPTDDEIQAALAQLIEELQEEGFSIEGW